MDSSNTPIADLAAEVHKEESWHARLPAVPIAVVVTTVVIASLAAVTGPVAGILTTTSQSTTNTLSSLVMNQAVDVTAIQVQDVLDQPNRLMQVLTPDTQLKNALLTNYNNLQKETYLYQLMFSMMNTTQWINGIACVTYPTGTSTLGPNSTFISNYKLVDSNNTAMWMDWSTNGFLVEAKSTPNNGSYGWPILPYEFPWNVVLTRTA
ncbi:hypothetical protein HDU76_012208, partial [Blyttiomyces sp. JEL0837]